MIILNSHYDELDKEIESLCQVEEHGEEVLIQNEIEDGSAILVFEPAWRVIDKNLIAVEGVYGSYDKTTHDFEPDWALTVIYENVPDEKFDPEKWLYFEQDSIATAIHNFLNYFKEDGK